MASGLLCTTDISACLIANNLTLCKPENDTCKEDHGYCIYNEQINSSSCFCLPCFSGDSCEEEKYSKNLWILFMHSFQTSNGTPVLSIIDIVLSIILLINGVICLQTYLCSERIRITNLGIYLIMLSMVSVVFGIEHVVFVSLNIYMINLPEFYVFAKISCLVYVKYVNMSLIYMYNWFTASIAIERMLIECFHYTLFDKRRRSLVITVLIIVICSLSTLPNTFTVRQNQIEQFPSFGCINFTPLGYIVFLAISYIHLGSFLLVYILMNVIVLIHVIKHRRKLVDDSSLTKDIILILRKHKDFFIPYLVQVLGLLPSFILEFMMTCSTGGTVLVARLYLTFSILATIPFMLSFYFYIYLSPVYMSQFWTSSLIGKSLRKLKIKARALQTSEKPEDREILETHF